FTRKAAAELRERFQVALEGELRRLREGGAEGADAVERLAGALQDVDRAFVGTIHAFCARLLRERPLEIGLDPGFQELPVEERLGLRRRFWVSYLERLARESDPRLEELARAGLRPVALHGLFERLVENPDVAFPVESAEAPSVAEVQPVREQLEGIVDRGWELMDEVPPEDGWDSFQRKIRRLHFEREVTGWSEPADLFGAIALLCKPATSGGHRTTLKRWRDRDLARSLREAANAFGHGDTPAQRIVDRWYAYRYGLVVRLARAAAEAFFEHRKRIGKLDFQDLLVLASRLLRDNPAVRRQLGRRYRRLLVDEFQDTDPLQAEIMLLLASEPDGEADWRTAVPRPGALFVVGDPKQSIYRFRRADIQLYGLVRRRFEDFGDVVSLSANFRSRPPIGDLVNGLFRDEAFFPEEATAEQAAFERLDTRPPAAPVPAEGVFTYELDPPRGRKEDAASDDGARIASWIRRRIDAGERQASDFLILTRDRGRLAIYARALEAYGLPVQVTGAGVGVEEEILELQVLLEAMIDPSNAVKVLSALVGLFFGLDYERLVAHRLQGGSLDAMIPGTRGDPDVLDAMRTLHGWWRRSTTEAADVFIGRLSSELGLLPLAAAGELGSIRAGALLYALDAVGAAALGGDASLPGAREALAAALELAEAEAPLEPGRPDAVRLMNLHQAKGLEGTVVVLADPTNRRSFRPDVHVARAADGSARGFLRVTEPSSGWGPDEDLARPMGWTALEAAERCFEEAEAVRLLYVAVTRAREELVVARWPDGRGSSSWEPLDPWLDEEAEPLEMPVDDPLPRARAAPTPDAVESAMGEAEMRLAESGRAGYRPLTVTELSKRGLGPVREAGEAPSTSDSGPDAFRGFSWGSAVHGALALASSESQEETLRAACRNLLIEHQRPVDDHGEPTELGELLALVRSVRASKLWDRAREADRVLAEIPFSLSGIETPPAADDEPTPEPVPEEPVRRQLDLFASVPELQSGQPGGRTGERGRPPGVSEEIAGTEVGEDRGEEPGEDRGLAERTVLEGIIDLAFLEEDGWVIADYKTDVGTDPDFPARERAYRHQVELYAQAWQRLTGEPVKERVLYFTAQDRLERW
ncbi:MAG: UvrD-helicase domain-containing protein, partial [Longimicrobiales bacterium]|nr:UvrD-helicase domain-containing protein [Longimicrobiales bacterium]